MPYPKDTELNLTGIQYYPRSCSTEQTTYIACIHMHNTSIKTNRQEISPGTSENANTHPKWMKFTQVVAIHAFRAAQTIHPIAGTNLKCENVLQSLQT